MSKDKRVNLYVTTVHRYGNRNGHSYIAGISLDKNRATLYGKAEYYYRGGCGKYEPYTHTIKIPFKTKNLYVIEMWDDKKNENFKFKIFVSRRKALEVFLELKEDHKPYDNIKLKQTRIDQKVKNKNEIDWLHSGWQFLNTKEQEVLRDISSSFMLNN